MKLAEANYMFMINKRSHLEFMVGSILRKDKMKIRNMIIRIKKNKEIYCTNDYEHMTIHETIEGVELHINIMYKYNLSSEEILFFFDIMSKPPYPTWYWENCTGDSVLKHIREYIDNVIVRKKITI